MTGLRGADLRRLARAFAVVTPALDSGQQRVALAVYRHLAHGEPASIESLAVDLSRRQADVEAVLRCWPGVERGMDGRIAGFGGLAIAETPHRFDIEGRRLHTWCAWDALFLPELIGCTARIDSRSPLSGEQVRLTVGPQGALEVHPASAVVSMLEPTECSDAGAPASFCHHSRFFVSPADAAAWRAEHRRTLLLSVDEAVELARLANRLTYPDALAS